VDLAIAAKILCDLSLWFCAATAILTRFGQTDGVFPAVGIMTLCCLLCYALKDKKLPLRLLPLLGLAFCAFWIKTAVDALLLIPPCLYCVWLCAAGRFAPDYSQAISTLKISAIALTLLLVLTSLIGMGSEPARYPLPFFLVFLFSGVAMLRLLRHDERKRKEWRLWLIALASLLACCAAALFFSSEFFLHAAGAALGALYRYIVAPILTGLAYLVSAIVWVVMQVFSFLKMKKPVGETPPKASEGVMELPDILEESGASGAEWLKQLLIAFAIIGFLALAFRIFRRLIGGDGASTQEKSVQETRTPLAEIVKTQNILHAVLAPRTPRETVRWYYRKFLLKAKAGGLTIAPSDTCERIAYNASALFDPELIAALREIYIVARYSPQAITGNDARRAKELYTKMKRHHET
jgi:hypothetical protein